jgi:integrase
LRVVKMGHMQNVKGSFRVRIVVPPELSAHLPPPYTGKKNLIKGLGTGNEREAKRLAVSYIADFVGLIEQARQKAKLIDPWDGEAWQVVGNRLVLAPPAPRNEYKSPPNPRNAPDTLAGDAVRFESMVEQWGREAKVPNRTKRQYLSKANRFVAFLETDRKSRGLPPCGDDMRLVTRYDYVRYKEHLLKPESGVSHTTAKHHLDDLRTLFIFASKNRSFTNPTDDVTRLSRKNGRNKWRPYTPEERIKILSAARKEGPVVRWCQWVAWATGSRVSEIAEASTQDICQIGGMWCIKILLDNREEEAELKNEESHRIVALHSALICEGFLDFVAEVCREYGEGPLFPMLQPDRDGRRGNPASRQISRWMRNKLKIKDTRIAPNHSWRHTFESVHRNDLEPPTREDTVNHITGRSQGGASGRHYGIYEIRRDRIEIERMPCPV